MYPQLPYGARPSTTNRHEPGSLKPGAVWSLKEDKMAGAVSRGGEYQLDRIRWVHEQVDEAELLPTADPQEGLGAGCTGRRQAK
jgi:hypothetical protein